MEDLLTKLKVEWHKMNNEFVNKDLEWCDDHSPIPEKINGYIAYPLLRRKATKEVAAYVNEHGYEMNSNGCPSHPVWDVLGVWDFTSRI